MSKLDIFRFHPDCRAMCSDVDEYSDNPFESTINTSTLRSPGSGSHDNAERFTVMLSPGLSRIVRLSSISPSLVLNQALATNGCSEFAVNKQDVQRVDTSSIPRLVNDPNAFSQSA